MNQNSNNNNNTDKYQIAALIEQYSQGWLQNSPKMVLDLYADTAIISPSGMQPIKGKKAITEFWFPQDGSTTEIHSYDLQIEEILVHGDLATSFEHGQLSFTYTKDDFVLNRSSESYAVSSYRKDTTGKWLVVHRIWTDMK